ncbi:MAG: hypothetical protein D6758_01820 [Gammaproteobacteria bacterium]|nr:MAG: hypothetical protein D6758_01820 [Gammaproteobacteria bacterium]
MSQTLSEVFEQQLAAFFKQRLSEAAGPEAAHTPEDVFWYLGTVLARLGLSAQLFSHDEDGFHLRPLALLYKDAHETPDIGQRCLILRQLGEQALFVGALFPDRYHRRGLDPGYFIGMGSSAYDYLSGHAGQPRKLFEAMARYFADYMEWVARAARRTVSQNADDIMAVYAEWSRTGSEHAAEQLRAAGIVLDSGKSSH